MFGKDFWNRYSEFRSNHLISVEQSQTCLSAKAASNRRLASAHHPDQNNRSADLFHFPISH